MLKPILQLLKIWEQTFEKSSNYSEKLNEFINKFKDYHIHYLKLQAYFKINQEYANWKGTLKIIIIDPIIKISDLKEAFSTINKSYLEHLKIKMFLIQAKVKNKRVNLKDYLQVDKFGQSVKMEIWNLIEKDLYDIKIEIIEK